MNLNFCVPSFLQNILLCVMVSLLLAMANQIQQQKKVVYVGENVALHCKGRYPMWFYVKEPDTTPTSSPISHYQLLSFRATHRHAGYYFCYGKFPQQDRLFLSRVRLQVVSGKL